MGEKDCLKKGKGLGTVAHTCNLALWELKLMIQVSTSRTTAKKSASTELTYKNLTQKGS